MSQRKKGLRSGHMRERERERERDYREIERRKKRSTVHYFP